MLKHCTQLGFTLAKGLLGLLLLFECFGQSLIGLLKVLGSDIDTLLQIMVQCRQ